MTEEQAAQPPEDGVTGWLNDVLSVTSTVADIGIKVLPLLMAKAERGGASPASSPTFYDVGPTRWHFDPTQSQALWVENRSNADLTLCFAQSTLPGGAGAVESSTIPLLAQKWVCCDDEFKGLPGGQVTICRTNSGLNEVESPATWTKKLLTLALAAVPAAVAFRIGTGFTCSVSKAANGWSFVLTGPGHNAGDINVSATASDANGRRAEIKAEIKAPPPSAPPDASAPATSQTWSWLFPASQEMGPLTLNLLVELELESATFDAIMREAVARNCDRPW